MRIASKQHLNMKLEAMQQVQQLSITSNFCNCIRNGADERSYSRLAQTVQRAYSECPHSHLAFPASLHVWEPKG